MFPKPSRVGLDLAFIQGLSGCQLEPHNLLRIGISGRATGLLGHQLVLQAAAAACGLRRHLPGARDPDGPRGVERRGLALRL